MSEHAHSKNSGVAAVIVLLVLVALVVWGIGLMNSGAYGITAVAGALTLFWGLIAVFVLGKE